MSDDLLVYYNRELSYLRKLGREFARAHPDVAPRLRLDAESGQDPYVERLLEGFAYLSARVRKKLDDDFPEIAEALLSNLYPHFLAPLPSMAIVQFALDPAQASLVDGYPLPRGTDLETEEVDSEACQFRTSFDVRLFPIRVAEAELRTVARRSDLPQLADAQTALRIRLTSFGSEGPFSKLGFDRLRFFIAGEPVHANAMYEALLTDVAGVVVSRDSTDQNPVVLSRDLVCPVGFEAQEAMLPHSPRSFAGYRLLTEYFGFAEKFRFIDVGGLSQQVRDRLGTNLEVSFYFRRRYDALQRNVSADMFRLGCSPIINLFTERVDPFRLTETKTRYHVVPDVRRVRAREVYSIDRVTASSPDGRSIEVPPFYAPNHSDPAAEARMYWYANRRIAGYVEGRLDAGTEVDISFLNLDASPAQAAQWTVAITATCLNRDLSSSLPFAAGRPRIRALPGGPLAPILCVTPPTPTRRPSLREGALWRLISHLSLNHLSLVEGEIGASALREILALHDLVRSPDTTAKLQGVLKVSSRRATKRLRYGSVSGVCRGLQVNILFDEQRYADNGLFLFASLVERFLPLYVSLNSFTQLVASSRQRENGVIHRWPPRAAETILL
jgi:type VI secretion system protein ImpG